MNYLKDFISFLKHPVAEEGQPINPVQVPKVAVRYYLIIFGWNILIGIILFTLGKTVLDLPERKTFDVTYYFIFLLIVGAPIVEELIFRLPLRFSKVNLLVSAVLLVIWMTRKDYAVMLIASSITAGVVGFLLFFKPLKIGTLLEKIWKKHFGVIFYLYAAVFGFMHIFNYQLEPLPKGFLVLLMVLPQLMMGLVMGYARMRYDKGLFVGMCIHFFNNAIAAIPYLLIHRENFF